MTITTLAEVSETGSVLANEKNTTFPASQNFYALEWFHLSYFEYFHQNLVL